MTRGRSDFIVESHEFGRKEIPMRIVVETSLLSARAIEVLLVLLAAVVCGVRRPPG